MLPKSFENEIAVVEIGVRIAPVVIFQVEVAIKNSKRGFQQENRNKKNTGQVIILKKAYAEDEEAENYRVKKN